MPKPQISSTIVKSKGFVSLSLALGLALCVVPPQASAQSNLSSLASIEMLSNQLGDMLYATGMVLFAIMVIKVAYMVFSKLYENSEQEKMYKVKESTAPPPRPSVEPAPVIAPIQTVDKEMLPQEYWIKDKGLKAVWLQFEEILGKVKNHKNYSKDYINFRNIEALKGNVLAVLEPYVANTEKENADNKKFYADIRSGILTTLQNSNVYLAECHEDLMHITKKAMKVDLIYLEQKLK